MKFLKWLGIVLASIIALILLIPLFLPSDFHVERSTEIERSPEIVFQTAVDMNQRANWDPWLEMEPNAEVKVEMTPEIIGSGYHWKGIEIGEGKMTIKEFVPNKLIKSDIEFIAPRSSSAQVIWNFENSDKGTKVTWAFEGDLSYPLEKWMGLFMDMMLSESFEKGLKNFKELVESKPEMTGRTGNISESQFEGLIGVAIKEKCEISQVSSKMMQMYSSLMKHLNEHNEEIAGFPFTIYHSMEEDGFITIECGLPVSKKLEENDKIKSIELPAGNTIMASHFGHYTTLKLTYEAIQKYIEENNLEIIGAPFEVYVTDPIQEPDQSKWETKVYFPIK